MDCEIREISPNLVSQYRDLRLRGLRENPEAFGELSEDFAERSVEEITSKLEKSKAQGGFILGAFSGDLLIGTVALGRQDGKKSRHRAGLWGMYVLPEFRNKKVGARLVQHLIAKAKLIPDILQIHLAVTVTNPSALKLYEHLGFRTYGTDPRVLKVGEAYLDEHLMVLDIKAG